MRKELSHLGVVERVRAWCPQTSRIEMCIRLGDGTKKNEEKVDVNALEKSPKNLDPDDPADEDEEDQNLDEQKSLSQLSLPRQVYELLR